MDPGRSWRVLKSPERSSFNNSPNSNRILLKFGKNESEWILNGPDGSWWVLMGPDGPWWVLKGPEGSWRVLTYKNSITQPILIGSCSKFFIGPDGSWRVLKGPNRSNFNNLANSNRILLKFGINKPKMGLSGFWVYYRTWWILTEPEGSLYVKL